MKVLLKGYSDLVHSYERFIKIQEEEEAHQREQQHRLHLEECAPDFAGVEKNALEKGKTQGQVLSILIILKTRFQNVPETLQERISSISESDKLEQLTERAVVCSSLEEFLGNE